MRFTRRLFAPNFFSSRQEIRLVRRNDLGDDFFFLREFYFFAGGDPLQNLSPFLRQLLNAGGFHAVNMQCLVARCKMAVPVDVLNVRSHFLTVGGDFGAPRGD